MRIFASPELPWRRPSALRRRGPFGRDPGSWADWPLTGRYLSGRRYRTNLQSMNDTGMSTDANAVTQRIDFSAAEANHAWLEGLPEQKILRPDVPSGATQPIGVILGIPTADAA
jgi:hypothetical protein